MQSTSVFLGSAKFADFRWKNADISRTFFYLLWVTYNCPNCHHRKTYFREGAFSVPTMREQPRRKAPSSIWLKSYKVFQNFENSHDHSKSMIKFRTKFQFQILLQFYRTAEKVTKIKLVMVMVKFWQIPIFSTFTFWLLFCHWEPG